MRPIIALSCSWEESEDTYFLSADYIRSIEEAGGAPIILPSLRQESVHDILQICSAIVFAGGGDIDPVYWGESPLSGLGRIDPERDRFELSLARLAYELRIPALGICRGCQLMNVACGGSLIQDIDSFLCHEQNAPRHYPFHDIVVKEGTLLHQLVATPTIRVNSFHHQAVRAAGRGITFCAWAEDGIVEAICSVSHPFWLGVQWHPESMKCHTSSRLFKALVQSCS